MLLVDEPTAQLDTRTSHSVSHVLGNLAGQGMIVLVATHDPDTRNACDRVIDLGSASRRIYCPTRQHRSPLIVFRILNEWQIKTSITLPLSKTGRSNHNQMPSGLLFGVEIAFSSYERKQQGCGANRTQ